MARKSSLTVIFIVVLIVLIFAAPYFYNKFVHAPAHSAQNVSQK